jgi:hypothetical protein
LLLVLLFYFWLTSSGRWSNWQSPTYYYADLAKAFSQGNLYLDYTPDPRLMALPDPYDSETRSGIEVPVDLSLYKERFYMYWGPVPALLVAIFQPFLTSRIGDLFLVFAFVGGLFLVQSFLLVTIWDRFFHTLPEWALYMSIFLGGLTGPLMLLRHNYDPARIYEASIAGGQFFLMSGLLMAFTAVIRSSIPGWRLALAGTLWALSVGTRQILAAPIGIMAIMVVIQLVKDNSTLLTKTIKILSIGLPLALGSAGLAWYNWARFGSIRETGLYYQLAEPNLRQHYTEIFSQSYFFQNVYNYLFNPLDFTPRFPFVFMLHGNEKPVLSYLIPEFYTAQPIVGLIYIFPFVIFVGVAILALFSNRFNGSQPEEKLPRVEGRLLTWILLTTGGSFLISFCLLTGYFWVAMRFVGDFFPTMMLFSILGFWMGYRFLDHRLLAKRWYAFVGIALAWISILISTLLVVSTNSRLINLLTRHFPFLR